MELVELSKKIPYNRYGIFLRECSFLNTTTERNEVNYGTVKNTHM